MSYIDLSFPLKAASSEPYPRINVDWSLSQPGQGHIPLTQPIQPVQLSPVEEIAMGPACWLWDYLR